VQRSRDQVAGVRCWGCAKRPRGRGSASQFPCFGLSAPEDSDLHGPHSTWRVLLSWSSSPSSSKVNAAQLDAPIGQTVWLPEHMCSLEQSARGLAQSMTLREVRGRWKLRLRHGVRRQSDSGDGAFLHH
jgi:hypothetical protein